MLTLDTMSKVLERHPEAVASFKMGGDMTYDLEADLWEYHFLNGDIRNYDADHSEFIAQRLAEHLGVE